MITLASWSVAAILQAIVPVAVPSANKQGSTGTKFFICTGSFVSGNLVMSDGNGNCADAGAAPGYGMYGTAFGNTTLADGNAYYVDFPGQGVFSLGVTVGVQNYISRTGVLRDLRVCAGTQGAGGNLTITANVNGANTAVQVVFAPGVGGCLVDTTHTANVAAGDLLSLELVNNATLLSATINDYSIFVK